LASRMLHCVVWEDLTQLSFLVKSAVQIRFSYSTLSSPVWMPLNWYNSSVLFSKMWFLAQTFSSVFNSMDNLAKLPFWYLQIT
jgi:hypothetical protein